MHIQGTCRTQRTLFPEALDDYVISNNTVRILDAFVEALDLQALGYRKVIASDTGRPPYHPGDLLKLYLYGYLHRIRSSRRLEAECHRNIEVIWLVQQLRPDFKTIADFRKDNAEALAGTFKALGELCYEAGLFGKELVAIDGSLFQAVNSKEKVLVANKLKMRLADIETDIRRYLEELDKADAEEDAVEEDSASAADIAALLEKLKERRNQTLADLEGLKRKGESQRTLVDKDARLIKQRHKASLVGYNTQIAVDNKHKLVVAYAVTNDANDKAQLAPMSEAAINALRVETLEVVADSGYYNGAQIGQAAEAGAVVYVPPVNTSSNKAHGRYDKSRFHYDKVQDCYHCPAGERLNKIGEDHNTGRLRMIYQTPACRDCTRREKCTSAKPLGGRKIYRWGYEDVLDAVRARHRARPERQKQRKATVEHPFGTLKRNWGYDHFLVKGKARVNAEMGLMLLAYNLKRVSNLLGNQTMSILGI